MEASDSNLLLEAALAYAAAGWPVFPCHPDTKQPLTKNGFKDATTDESQIRAWWRRWPEAMVGLPTGLATGLLVVDLDPKEPQTAEDLLDDLRQAVGEALQPCPLLRTPRAGLHLYLAYPKGLADDQVIGNRAGIIPGIDLRGEGGYVVTAPSLRKGAKSRKAGLEGKAYAFEEDAGLDDFDPPAPSPALLRFLTSRHGQDAAPTAPPQQPLTADDRARKYALAALDREARGVAAAPSGRRNQALNDAAFALGQLVGAGALSEAVAQAALVEAAHASGLAKDDGMKSVMATLKSGFAGGRAKPRDLREIAKPMPPARRSAAASPRRGELPPSQGSRERGEAGLPQAGGGGGPGDDDIDPAVLRSAAGQPLNDTGNGHRLRAHFGDDFINVREVGPHAWAGSHWEPQGAKEAMMRWAQVTAARIAEEADVLTMAPWQEEALAAEGGLDRALLDKDGRSLTEEQRKQKSLIKKADAIRRGFAATCDHRAKWGVDSGMAPRLRAMIDCSLVHCTVPPEAMDSEALAINLQNGTLRLFKESFKEEDPDCPDPDVVRYIEGRRWAVRLDPHSRDDRFAKTMPVAYDAEAACPKWQDFVERFQPKEGIRRFLQAFHGYALTGLVGEQAFVFNYGLGANGKSTFMEAIARLMGSYAQVLPAEALTGDLQRRGDQATPEYARLPGARLVRCAELPRGQGFRESTLKLLTGGEAMLVRHLHQGFFEMRPTFKAIGSGNDRPSIGGVDEGIWRRMKLVPWEVTIPASERRPMERVLRDFASEGPGILNWLLEGLIDYLENGLVVPPEIQAATESYRSDMDPVGEFAAACVVAEPGAHVTARDLYHAYVDWCAANSVKAWAEKTFAGVMVQKGFKKESGRIRRYLDITLRDVPTNPERDGGAWGGPHH